METGKLHNANDMKSVWKAHSAGSGFNALTGDITADVVIIGGGITGITTAQLLKETGLNVVVAEAMKVGQGSTGGSTGNLYTAVEEGFDVIQSKYNSTVLAQVVSARGEALQMIRQNVQQLHIDCDFKQVPWYLYSSNDENKSKVKKVYKAALDADLPVACVLPGELPFPVAAGIKMAGQAQFNPLRYVQQLAKVINGANCRIYEDTPVTAIDDENEDVKKVRTPNGTISAKYVVHASHTPKGVFLDFHSLLSTYREYGVAAKLASGNYPEGIMWGYYNENDRFSVRSYEHEGEKYILAVGQPHGVGQKEDNDENIQNLENFLTEHFDVAQFTNRWGGQNYKPADGLPYIGRKSNDSNVFVATGFSTDGLIYGVLSAIIIRDLIGGKETAYTKLFDATRHNPVKAAGKVIKEAVVNAGEVIMDYIFHKDAKLEDIPAGEGKVVDVGGKKLAVYNEQGGTMKACSAICTHLGCVVHWNNAEKTWDCPCHASRFDTDGGIIEGPALIPLKKVTIKNDN